MDSKGFSDKFYSICCCLVAFVFPFGQPFINYAIVLLAIGFAISFSRNHQTSAFTKKLFLLPALFYILHLVGLLYSANLKYGFADVQTKFTLLFFPLIFTFHPFDKKYNVHLKWCFITGVLLTCIYNLATSYVSYFATKEPDDFFYSSFSKLMHPTYFTIYLNIATLFLIDLFSSKEQSRWIAILQVIIFVFFMMCIMLLSSRTAIITSYITILLLIGLKIKDGFNAKKHLLAGVIALALIIVSDFLVFSHNNRFEQVEILFNGDNDFYKFDKKEYNSATIRIPLWINAAQVIENNKLLGVGTGDIKEELDSIYKKNKFAYAEASHFSPHNQVFHTGIILGFAGIALLLAMLLIPLYYSIRYKSYLLLCFIVIFLFNMMTESILERQAGLILFSFFYVILVSELYEDIKKADEVPA